jgi:hypothetical protein
MHPVIIRTAVCGAQQPLGRRWVGIGAAVRRGSRGKPLWTGGKGEGPDAITARKGGEAAIVVRPRGVVSAGLPSHRRGAPFVAFPGRGAAYRCGAVTVACRTRRGRLAPAHAVIREARSSGHRVLAEDGAGAESEICRRSALVSTRSRVPIAARRLGPVHPANRRHPYIPLHVFAQLFGVVNGTERARGLPERPGSRPRYGARLSPGRRLRGSLVRCSHPW